MPIQKTPHASTQQLRRSLESIEKAVQKATKSDGTVDVKKLEAGLARADEGAKLGLESIVDAFQREYTYSTGGGCGSSSRTHVGHKDPTALTAGEAQSVLTALVQARAKAESFDTHKASGKKGKDGAISAEESARAMKKAGDDLAGKLATSALEGAERTALDGAGLGVQLESSLERAAAAVRVVAGRDGSVDVSALQMAFARLPEEAQSDGLLDAIKSAFQRTQTVRVSSGCSSTTETRYVDPTKLSRAEATEVHDALEQALQLIADKSDGDGDLSTKRLRSLKEDASALGGLVESFVDLVVEPHLPAPPPAPSRSYGGC